MKTKLITSILLGLILFTCYVQAMRLTSRPLVKGRSLKRTSASNDVVIKDLKMYVDGKEFVMKAIAYQPAPLGIASMSLSGFGGGGFCSAKKTAFGEYKSACFGSDYFDGVTSDPNRTPPGPTDSKGNSIPYWQETWIRDFKKMKEMGVNTLRIYNMAFVTKQFIELYPDEYQVTDPERAAEHSQFVDLAHEYGFKLILPIVQDESFLGSSTSAQIDKHIESTVTELGDHPALIMWCLGNEMGVDKKPTLLDLVNKKMQVVRDKMKSIHNRSVPITHAVVDDPSTYDFLIANLKVDVFTTNAGYRDIHMDPLWEGGEGSFEGWSAASKTHNLPMFVGEFGMHQEGDEITQAKPDWFNQQWKSIVDHIDDGTIGGCFFEYSDELNKDGMQKNMGAIKFKQATGSDGKTSVDEDSWVLDEIEEKEFLYDSITKGLDNSSFKAYNFNANVFTLLGRKQSTIDGGTIDPTTSPSVSTSTGSQPRDSSVPHGHSSTTTTTSAGSTLLNSRTNAVLLVVVLAAMALLLRM